MKLVRNPQRSQHPSIPASQHPSPSWSFKALSADNEGQPGPFTNVAPNKEELGHVDIGWVATSVMTLKAVDGVQMRPYEIQPQPDVTEGSLFNSL